MERTQDIRVCSVLSHTGWGRRDRGTVVTYVAKAPSLAKTLIKPLTITPTKPDLKAIHLVCTKESGGMQVLSRPPLRHERCLLHLKAQLKVFIYNNHKYTNSVPGGTPTERKSVEFCSCLHTQCNLLLSDGDNLRNWEYCSRLLSSLCPVGFDLWSVEARSSDLLVPNG